MNESVWIFGAGPMAIDYQKVLERLDVGTCVFGRGQESAQRFKDETGQTVVTDSFETKLPEMELPQCAIIATNVESLCELSCRLLEVGVPKLLVEKPGGMSRSEIHTIQNKAVACGTNVFVGYNRRFYDSVTRAKEMIQEDGGLLSMHFEFTEWSHKIAALNKSAEVKKTWVLGNSSHVLDLAFYLGGYPDELHCVSSGELDWHPSGSIYAGSGKTNNGALFSYHANWESAGRWGLELLTRRHRLYLKPLEELYSQEHGQLQLEQVTLMQQEDSVDLRPGLLEQVRACLESDLEILCTIEEHAKMVDVYYKIANYR